MVLLNSRTYKATSTTSNPAFNLKVPQLDLHPCFKEFENFMRDVNKSPSDLFVSTSADTSTEQADPNLSVDLSTRK
jgi:hypothetical protein